MQRNPACAVGGRNQLSVTTAAMVPAMLLMILDFDGRAPLRPETLRMVYTASAPISL